MQSAEVESTVEAVGECRQVSSGVLTEVECMIASGQAGLEIAQDGVDPLELRQVFRLSSGDDGWLMDAPGFGDGAEAGETIGRHGAARGQMRLGPNRDGLEGEAGYRRERDAQGMPVVGERERGDERDLVLGSTTGLAAAALASKVGIIDLDLPFENIALFALGHGVHQLVLNQPRRRVTDAQLPLEGERGQPGLRLADQVDGQKPDRQAELCALKDRTGNQRGLMPAGVALEQLAAACTYHTMGRATAARAAKAVRPARLHKRRVALGFHSVPREKVGHRQTRLKLNSVHCHEGILSLGTVYLYSLARSGPHGCVLLRIIANQEML